MTPARRGDKAARCPSRRSRHDHARFAPVLKTRCRRRVIVVGAGIFYGMQQRRADAPSDVAATTQPEPAGPAAEEPVVAPEVTKLDPTAPVLNAAPTPAEESVVAPELTKFNEAATEPVLNAAPSKFATPDPASYETAAGNQPAARTPEDTPAEISYETDQGRVAFVFRRMEAVLSAGTDGRSRC